MYVICNIQIYKQFADWSLQGTGPAIQIPATRGTVLSSNLQKPSSVHFLRHSSCCPTAVT